MKISLTVLTVLFLSLALSCDKAELVQKPTDEKKVAFKPSLVQPPDYTLYASDREKNHQGVYSVYGVAMNFEQLLGKQVRVSGRVSGIHLCDKAASQCPQKPYLVISDRKLPEFALFLGTENDQGLKAYEEGKLYTFSGALIQYTADGRLFRTEGVLLMPPGEDEVEDESVEGEAGEDGAATKKESGNKAAE